MESEYKKGEENPTLPEDRITDFIPSYLVKNMRSDYEIYSVFYKTFIPTIVGKRFFGSMMNELNPNSQNESPLCTVSDEALALLGFENGFKVWKDVWVKSEGAIRHIRKDEKVPPQFMSDKATKYTTHYNADGTVNSHYRFWSIEGIERFNALRGKIKESRAKHPKFF